MSCQTNYINDCLNKASFQYQFGIENYSSYDSLIQYLESQNMHSGLCHYFLSKYHISPHSLPILRDNNSRYMVTAPYSCLDLQELKESLKLRLQLIHDIQFEYHKELLANS